MVELPSKVVFGNEDLKKEFERLKESSEKEVHKHLIRAIEDLSRNAFCGVQLPKRLIPEEYKRKFGNLTNLWKYNLPNAWRLIYSIKTNEVYVLSVLLEWADHKEYERRFKY